MRYDQTLGATIANVSRRSFLTGVAAGSLVLAVGVPVRSEEQKYAGAGMPNGLREDPKIFIAIGEDGTVRRSRGVRLAAGLLGLAVTRPVARLTTIRQDLLAPVILALVAIAAIADRGRPLDLVVVAAFGIVGLVLQRHGWPRVPFVIAFVLGAAFEDNLLLTLRLIDLGRVDLADRPLTWLLVLLVLATMAWMWRTSRKLRAEA